MDDATLRQVQAAEPDSSTWLSANAGSGKTRVLTDRVARLLLVGVQPQNILCLTYTKAAASEMQNRLFKRLGAWSMMPIAELRQELARLGVGGLEAAETLADARRLFARAIETPGGLRIQTIHSYCASLLRRFPLEAGVTPNFTEMDDRSATLLRDQVIEDMAERDPHTLDRLAAYLSGDDLEPVVSGILSHREAFEQPRSRDEIWGWFGLGSDVDQRQILADVFSGDEPEFMPTVIRQMLASAKPTDQKVAERLTSVNWEEPGFSDLDTLCAVFLYGASAKAPFSAKIGSLPTKDCRAGMAGELDLLNDLMRRVEDGRDRKNGLLAAQKTHALHGFAHLFLDAYDAEKTRRGWLDFDDLILKTRSLLSHPQVAQWVLYRLDGGLDHILVDEAQDTSPAQWQVVEKLAQELTAGQGARDDTQRTIFVVGDKKQSIYSFQGADPAKFDEMREHFRTRLADGDQPLRPLELEYSFRSSQAVLRFVDSTVRIDPIAHRAFFDALPGRVDIWPAVPVAQPPDDQNWYDPVDIVAESNHNVRLAEEIAAFMKRTIGRETIPDTDGTRRKVQASDFLILVRRRSTLFEAVIRACKSAGLPVAGADRLKLGAELAVKDLVSLLSFLATPEDDLSLASALRSPLFGWSESDLFQLAAGRGDTFLWQAFRQRRDAYPDTYEVLSDLLEQADFLRPYDLIERVLVRHDGRRKLLGRLGAEAVDGIDALLSQALGYERTEVPSLTGFLTWLDTNEVEIKRQLDDAGDLIRVMTVHGAKGLESRIVILPDTAKRTVQMRDQIVELGNGHGVWRVPADQQPSVIADAIEAKKNALAEEDERLFYVAATRAETWLIFAGAGHVGEADASWYSKAWAGLETMGALPLDTPLGLGQRYAFGDWDHSAPTEKTAVSQRAPTLPAWTMQKASVPEKTPEPRSPSDLGGAKALAGIGGQDEEQAKTFGTLVHRLLEFAQARIDDLEAKTLLAGTASDALIKTAADTARRVLAAPDLASVFGEDALTEVSLTAEVAGLGPLSGTIDRLLVTPETVTAIDFKTNVTEPKTPLEVPEGLLRQMGAYLEMLRAIYPTRHVKVALLWTGSARLMYLPHEIVRDALQRASTS
jgi:ATP-dependent helicase/nuclease subunit A